MTYQAQLGAKYYASLHRFFQNINECLVPNTANIRGEDYLEEDIHPINNNCSPLLNY